MTIRLLASRTQFLGMIACGLGAGLVTFMAGVGVGMHPTEANGRLMGDPIPQSPPSIATPLPQATIKVPGATITKYLPQATKTITVTKVAPSKQLTCGAGKVEDSCYPDYIGGGRWVLRAGERPTPKVAEGKQIKSMPKATKKAPGATIAGVCRHPSITKGMVADCNKLAKRPAEVTPSYSNPKGADLVRECTEQYKGDELATCLK